MVGNLFLITSTKALNTKARSFAMFGPYPNDLSLLTSCPMYILYLVNTIKCYRKLDSRFIYIVNILLSHTRLVFITYDVLTSTAVFIKIYSLKYNIKRLQYVQMELNQDREIDMDCYVEVKKL